MTLKMSEGGEKVAVVETPTYIVTPNEASHKKGIQKKHILIVVGMVILAGLIIAGILIGMHIFSEAQKEIVKFSLEFKSTSDGEKVQQDVTSDPNDNVVVFKVTKDGKDAYIVNDFNRGIQVVKMETSTGTNCYISALNVSAAQDSSQINAPATQSDSKLKPVATFYTWSTTPITDRTFLAKKAQDMCSGISMYWTYRGCNGQNVDPPPTNNGSSHDPPMMRSRRNVYSAGYYNGYPCLNGCCYTICSCNVVIVEHRSGNTVYCDYYYDTRCGYYAWRQATPGLYC